MILSAMLLAFAGFLGLVMELYKKTIRKDLARELEIRVVALCGSLAFGYATFRLVRGTALAEGINDTHFAIVLFAIVIYLLQLPACMAVWKPLVKRFMERKAGE